MTRPGFLGLGSNIGDRRAHLVAAVAALGEHGVEVLASSSVYETEPVGLVLDQPEFYNACLSVSTALDPERLLDACKAVERELGRAAGGPRHGPRVIDVDLLLLGDREYSVAAADVAAPRGHEPALRVGAAARARPRSGATRRRRAWPSGLAALGAGPGGPPRVGPALL